jgi:hypothetical protein
MLTASPSGKFPSACEASSHPGATFELVEADPTSSATRSRSRMPWSAAAEWMLSSPPLRGRRTRRGPPSLTDYQRNKLAHDLQVERWVERLTRSEEDDPALDDPEINVGGLSEEKRAYVLDEVLKRRVRERERFALGHWSTKRVLASPT